MGCVVHGLLDEELRPPLSAPPADATATKAPVEAKTEASEGRLSGLWRSITGKTNVEMLTLLLARGGANTRMMSLL